MSEADRRQDQGIQCDLSALAIPGGIMNRIWRLRGNFEVDRHLAAFLGLVPRQHSTGGKTFWGETR